MVRAVVSDERMVVVAFEIPESLYVELESKASFRRVSLEEAVFGKKVRASGRQPSTVRVPFVFEDYMKLTQMSDRLGQTVSATLKKAIRLLVIYLELKESGGKLLSRRKRFLRRSKTTEVEV